MLCQTILIGLDKDSIDLQIYSTKIVFSIGRKWTNKNLNISINIKSIIEQEEKYE